MKVPLLSLTVSVFFSLLSLYSALGETTVPPKMGKKIAFHGKLLSINSHAQTITVEDEHPRAFYLEHNTKIMDHNAHPSSLASASMGEYVRGYYAKDTNGRLVLLSVQFGVDPPNKTPSRSTASTLMPANSPVSTPLSSLPTGASTMEIAPARRERPQPMLTPSPSAAQQQQFAGRILFTNRTSFVLKDKTNQVFLITSDTKITDATGIPTTVRSLGENIFVSGTCTGSPEGGFIVQFLKIGQ